MKATSKVNNAVLKRINRNSELTLIETADALKTHLINSQTMPFDSGDLQNTYTFVDDTNSNRGEVSIVSDTPYARRLYFHPEYNFKKNKNPNAGGMWFEPYISGSEKDFIKKTFTELLRGKV